MIYDYDNDRLEELCSIKLRLGVGKQVEASPVIMSSAAAGTGATGVRAASDGHSNI